MGHRDVELLFEISLSLGASLDLEQMLREAVSTMLRLLNCCGAQVLRAEPGMDSDTLRWLPMVSIPRPILRSQAHAAFLRSARLPSRMTDWQSWAENLPYLRSDDGKIHHLFDLPAFGALVLEKIGEPFEENFLRSLQPLLDKLANGSLARLEAGERRKTEMALRESEARWAFALEGAGDGVWDWNATTNEVYFSRKWKEMLGYEEHEIGSALKEWDERVHPHDRERVYADLDRHFSGETAVYTNEHRVRCKDGTYKWILDRGKVMSRAPDGKPVRVIGTHTDITERKQVEAALRESAERLRILLDNIQIQVWYLIDDHTYGAVNEAHAAFNGVKKEDLAFKDLYGLYPREMVEICRKGNAEVFATGRPVHSEEWVPHSSGEKRLLSILKSPKLRGDGTVEYVVCSAEDVTERKRAEDALKAKEELLSATLRSIGDGVMTADAEGRVVSINRVAERLTGWPTNEAVGLPVAKVFRIVDPRTGEKPDDPVEKVLRGREAVGLDEEVVLVSRDGAEYQIADSCAPIFVANGEVMGAVLVFRDVTAESRRRKLIMEYDDLLYTVSRATTQFVASNDWTSTLHSTLPDLGRAARASRVYYFSVDLGDESDPIARQTHEWCAPGIAKQIDNPALQNLSLVESGYSRWVDLMITREQIAGLVSDFPTLEREILEQQDIRSIVVAPVFAGARWVGFLGFDECMGERTWTVPEREVLSIVADALGSAIERQATEKSLAQARLREVDTGAQIQRTLLSGDVPKDLRCVEIGALTIPSQRIDGDFFEVVPHSDMLVDVVLGDVMGKGVPAALVSAATKSLLLRTLGRASSGKETQIPEPAELVSTLNGGLTEQLVAIESFVTMGICRFDAIRQVMTLVDCGHTATIHVKADGSFSLLKSVNLPIGVSLDERYVQQEFPFQEGDLIVIYSDGTTEARNVRGEEFGVGRMVEVARAARGRPANEIVAAIRQAVTDFSGADTFSDDFTCLCVVIPPGSRRRELRLTSSLDALCAVREFVQTVCAQRINPTIDEDWIHGLVLAANEAFTNVVIHAYARETHHPIALAMELQAEQAILEISHHGRAFDPDTVARPSFDGSRDGGFGLHLIRQSVDELAFVQGEGGGTTIRMRKNLARA